MGLGAGFWTGDGESAMWLDDWTGYEGLYSAAYENWVACGIGKCKFFQAPYTIWSAGGTEALKDPGFDTGYFWLDNQGNDDVWYGMIVHLTGVPGTVQDPQYIELDPASVEGDFQPYGEDIASDNAGYIRTPYNFDNGPNYPDEWLTDMGCIIWFQGSAGTFRLHHYAPYAWTGTVPEIIASIAMQAGVDPGDIDQDAFDQAHDAYALTTGDAPWKDLDEKWELYCSRKIGTRVVDLIIEVAEHARDWVFMNQKGQLSISSFTSPNNVISGLGYADDDGVLDECQWEYTEDYMFNTVFAGWGTGFRTFNFDTLPPDETGFSVAEERTLESQVTEKWIASSEVAPAIAKYRARWLRGRRQSLNLRGQPEQVVKSHFPFLLSLHDAAESMVPFEYWPVDDSIPKADLTVKQNALGLDYSVGDVIENVQLTGDGKTISSMVCTEKEVNFDSMTCRSTLVTKEP